MERVTLGIYSQFTIHNSQFTIKSFLRKTLFLLAARHSANKFALCSRSAASGHNYFPLTATNRFTIWDFFSFRGFVVIRKDSAKRK